MRDPSDRIRQIFDDAGVRGSLHAVPVADAVGPDDAVAYDADRPVPMVSVYKLPLAVAWCRAVDDGARDPREPMLLAPSDRTPGATGVSTLEDEVRLSRRDVVRLMLTLSDNAAADAVLTDLGLEPVDQTLKALGLAHTTVRGGEQHHVEIMVEDTGTADFAHAMKTLADVDLVGRSRIYDPAVVSSTTARDMTRLLTAIWNDAAASPESCAFLRSVLTQQVWGHRLASGFPYDDVSVAGKTGTMVALRHEVGVVTFPDEVPVAVAVFTKAARADLAQPRIDLAIGAAARAAVTPLRRPLPAPAGALTRATTVIG